MDVLVVVDCQNDFIDGSLACHHSHEAVENIVKFIKENEYCVVFADLHPKAKVHLLVVPKKHFKDIMETDEFYINKIFETIKEVAKEQNLSSFRIVNNCGKGAGQSVFHVHFHVLSGDNLKE